MPALPIEARNEPAENFFEVLGQPTRPWLDPKNLHAAYLARIAAVHPDHAALRTTLDADQDAAATARLNRAFQILSEPRSRLQHLLQCVGVSAATAPPPEVAGYFFELAQTLSEADSRISKLGLQTSPLLKARQFAETSSLLEKLELHAARVASWLGQGERSIEALDAEWPSVLPTPNDPVIVPRLRAVHATLSFASKWAGQIQERRLKLSL